MVNQKLRAVRKSKRCSMQVAAERVGVDRVTYSRWERGVQDPQPTSLDMLCQAFEMSPEELGYGHLVATSGESEDTDMALKRRELMRQAIEIGAFLSKPGQRLLASPFVNSAAPIEFSAGDAMLLDHFNKLTTICWDLLRVDGLPTVGQLLPTFLPEITEIAKHVSPGQKEAAGLAAQAHILAGLSETLRLNHADSEIHCKQAILFSRIAENRTLEAAALKHLAVKYFDLKYPLKTLHTYQEALPFINEISPLMKSRIFLGLAAAYAQSGQEQEALRYFAMSQEIFPEDPEADPAFVYADCGRSSLNHYGGLIYLELDQPQKAWEVFSEVEALKQKIVIPERTIVEIVNCQAEAAVAQRNLELASAHLKTGLVGAIKLKSERRFAETFAVYKQMRFVWPHEPEVKALAELFHR